MNIAVRQYCSFGQQLFFIKTISSSQCLTTLYEAWSQILDLWSLLSFGTRQITTMIVVFGNSGMLPLAFCQRALPNPSPVIYRLAFPSSSPPKLHLHISSKTSQTTVTKSIWHYQMFPNAARSWKSANDLQLPSPSAGVHPAAVSNVSFPGEWTAASSPKIPLPIVSSTCWMYQRWAAPSIRQIASRRIPFASH